MTGMSTSKQLCLFLLMASFSLSLAQDNEYCSIILECNGDVQGGTWCNENEANCDKCGGTWCTDNIIEPTIDNAQDEKQNFLSDSGIPKQVGAEQDDEGLYRYIVKFKDTADGIARARRMESRALESQLIDILSDDNAEVMKLMTEEEVREWEERDDVEYVEKDHVVIASQSGETRPYGIDLVRALSVSDQFVSNTKVCVVDTGYDIGHPDLPKGSVVTGSSINGLQWNQDPNGHGTHVAGTIVALGGNRRGVVGVVRSGRLNLHISRVLDANGSGFDSAVIRGVEACQRAGANVINLSLGSRFPSETARRAYDRVASQGVLIVAAAGNGGDMAYSYPASYNSVMSVAAVNRDKRLASFSQRNDQVDIAGPGVGVLSTIPGGRYARLRGTSMASPHVAGVAALVWSHFPGKSAQQIRRALEGAAEDLGTPGRDNSYGHGLVRADLAFQFLRNGNGNPAPSPPSAPPPTPNPPSPSPTPNPPSPTPNPSYVSYTNGEFPDRCLGLPFANASNLSKVWLCPCYESPAQKWKLDSDGFLRSQLNQNKCVVPKGNASIGAPIVIYDCSGPSQNMKWKRDALGRLRLQSDNTKCIGVKNSSGGRELQIERCNGNSEKIWNVA